MTSFVEEDWLYIIQEYAQNGDLQTFIRNQKSLNCKRLNETELWRIMYEILLGISYLHSNNIIHRDLKPLNIFLTSNQSIKIGDLGVSRIVTSNDNDEK